LSVTVKRPVGVGVEGLPIAIGIRRTTLEPRLSTSVRADRSASSERRERHIRGRSWRTSTQPIWLFWSEVATTPSQGPRRSTAHTTVGEPQAVVGPRCATTRPFGRLRSVMPRSGAIAASAPAPAGTSGTCARAAFAGAGAAVWVVAFSTALEPPQPATATVNRIGMSRARLICNELSGHAVADHAGTRAVRIRGAGAAAAQAGAAPGAAGTRRRRADLA